MTVEYEVEDDVLEVRIPMTFRRQGGRKVVIAPDKAERPDIKPKRDETLIRALVKAYCWRQRIESGAAKSITDLAAQEGVTDAYVCRLLPLTCLAPEITAAILDGRQPGGFRLSRLTSRIPLGWDEQRRATVQQLAE